MSSFKVTNVEDLDVLYTLLRENYPDNRVEVTFDYNTKEYSLTITDKLFKCDPEVPVDLNVEVVYGDSVTGDTPLVLRDPNTNQVHIKTIDKLCTEWQEYPEFKLFDQSIRLEKQYGLTNYEVWCDKGWNKIKKVIKHKTDKKIYRVLTHTGVVDVTEDHSLITPNFEKVKPKDINVGDDLLHSFPDEFPENEITMVNVPFQTSTITKVCKQCQIEKDVCEFYKASRLKDGRSNKCRDCDYYINSTHPLRNIQKNFSKESYVLTEDEAKVWGFFAGDGSAGFYKCKSGEKWSFALNNNNWDRLERYKEILERVEPMKFKILDTLESSGVYKLVPSGSIKYMVQKYRPLFYDVEDANEEGDKLKIVPSIILNASRSIKLAFFEGYYEADGSKTNGCNFDTIPRFAIKGKIGAQGLYYLTRSIGFNMGLNVLEHDDKKKYVYLDYTTFRNKKEVEVKKTFQIGNTTQDNFVYDLETELGRFNAGVGQLVVVNTDSVFLKFKYNRDDFNANRVDTFRLAILCGNKLTKEIFDRHPIEMEFEKVFQPFVLLTKKRYIANKYENTKDPFQLKGVDAKGIALTRRDYCKMVKNCYKEIIDTIMKVQTEAGLKESVCVFKEYIARIDKYDVPLDDLVVSAMLAKSYKTKPVHVVLAEKLKERKEEASVGDRIQYIYIESDDPTKKKSELGEDPVYATKNGLKFNRTCYLEQLAKPILGFFSVVLKEHKELFHEVLNYVNVHLEKYGGKRLTEKEFKKIE